MNIAVVGSFQLNENLSDSTSEEKFQLFSMACSAIGKAIGNGNHRLMVAHRYNPHGPNDSAEAIALEGFRKTLRRAHFVEVPHHKGDPQLKAHTDAVDRSDAVILIGGKEGTYAAGLSALLRRKMIITIPAFGGSARDLCEIDGIEHTVIDTLRNLDTNEENWVETLTEAISAEINSYPRILIVHGRGDDGTALLKEIAKAGEGKELKGIGEPLIMELSGKAALSIPEVFETFASRVSATIAIVTADDVGGFARRDDKGGDSCNETKTNQGEIELPATELRLTPRARENVWVEVGWFWGRLGRRRVFLWLKDDVPLPSDLQGAAWTRGDLTRAWPHIQRFIISLRKGDKGIRNE
ncbi:MAG: hypothetical protein FP814_09340 [Desulfobacterium sp.]|nr:hypothetical protein [Desulfobacterium sp.]